MLELSSSGEEQRAQVSVKGVRGVKTTVSVSIRTYLSPHSIVRRAGPHNVQAHLGHLAVGPKLRLRDLGDEDAG